MGAHRVLTRTLRTERLYTFQTLFTILLKGTIFTSHLFAIITLFSHLALGAASFLTSFTGQNITAGLARVTTCWKFANFTLFNRLPLLSARPTSFQKLNLLLESFDFVLKSFDFVLIHWNLKKSSSSWGFFSIFDVKIEKD